MPDWELVDLSSPFSISLTAPQSQHAYQSKGLKLQVCGRRDVKHPVLPAHSSALLALQKGPSIVRPRAPGEGPYGLEAYEHPRVR